MEGVISFYSIVSMKLDNTIAHSLIIQSTL